MFCENGRSAIHVLNCEKCVKVRRRETTWDRRDTPRLPGGSTGGGNLVRRGFWVFFRFCRILPGRRPALRSPSSPGGGRARERVPESVLQRKSPSAHLKLSS